MPDDVKVELYYSGTWNDLTAAEKVFTESPITVTRGDSAESAAPRPGTVGLQLDNADDRFRTSNPESPLYGLAGRNTPLRVSVDGMMRGAAEATSWSSSATRSFRETPARGRAWTDVEGGGLLARVNNWKDPLRSPFFTYNNALASNVGYWPVEEAEGARTLSVIPATAVTRTVRGAEFGGQAIPPGSDAVATMSPAQTAFLAGNFAPHTSAGNGGWQVSWVHQHNKISGSGSWGTILQLRPSDAGYVLVDRGDSNKIRLQVYTSTLFADPALLNVNATLSPVASDLWALYVLRATRSGTTITLRLFRQLETETGFTEVLNGTYTGSLAQLDYWQAVTTPDEVSAAFGHMIGVVGQGDDLTASGRSSAFLGYAGERTAYRFARLCGLKGLQYFLRGDANLSAIMGPQRAGTLADQFREIRDTEDGLIFDEKGSLALIFTLLNDRYNQTPTVLAATDLPFLPDEVADDLGVHNLITVKNRNGGEVTVEDATGRLGTAPPPTGVGEYEFTADVSLNDPVAGLPQLANWWLRRGTVDLPRYPKLTIDLAALEKVSPGKVSEVLDLDIGKVIELTGFRENTIRLFVIGYTEVIGWPLQHRITFTTAPDQQFHVRAYGTDANQARYDMKTATIKVAATSTATQLILKATDDETWSNTSTYDVMIAGERITFQAGQMGARTGSAGNYQQIVQNVLRSRNGVVKPLPVGAEIHVFEQGRWAL